MVGYPPNADGSVDGSNLAGLGDDPNQIAGDPSQIGYDPNQMAYLPPDVPTLFYPSDPSVTLDPQDAYPPPVPGVALAVTAPGPATDPDAPADGVAPQLAGDPTDAGASDGSPVARVPGGASPTDVAQSDISDALDDLGTLPLDAAPWQTTRYLRLANATPKKVSVQLRYFVETGPHKTAGCPSGQILPTAPGRPSNWRPVKPRTSRTATGESMPGESVSGPRPAIRNGISSAQALNLVPEAQYQALEPQVFNYTVR